MIPTQFISKMGIYALEIKDVQFKVSVIDHASVIDQKISELNGLLLERRRVVGFDVKFNPQTKIAEMLILCAANLCLAIQLCGLFTIPECLKNFLADKTICFVGIDMNKKVTSIRGKMGYIVDCYTGIDLGRLAARVLKKPKLIELTEISELAKEVGIDYTSLSNKEIGALTHPTGGLGFSQISKSCMQLKKLVDVILLLTICCLCLTDARLKYANYALACVCFHRNFFLFLILILF